MQMRWHPLIGISLGLGILTASFLTGCAGTTIAPTASKEAVGKALFNDTSLSEPAGQSCGTCHQAQNSFTDQRGIQPTSQGAVAGLFGNRQTPTLRYMGFAQPFHYNATFDDFEGGQFWDGRATDLKDQAHFPMINPAEMNNPSLDAVVAKVAAGPQAAALKQIYGPGVFADTATAMNAISDAIAAFENTAAFRPFTSKYDYYLKGQAVLTPAEKRGLDLFQGSIGCSGCHPSQKGPHGEPPLFTIFIYSNLGIPRNPANPFYGDPASINPDGAAFVDHGLIKTTGRPQDDGNFKTPTLRNVAVTAPYFHNGVFKTLEEVIHFYNARDVGGFDPPEVSANLNKTDLGNLGLTPSQESDIVAFLKTLTDGWYH